MTLENSMRNRRQRRTVFAALVIVGCVATFAVSANAARPGGDDQAMVSDHQLIAHFTDGDSGVDELTEMASELWARRGQLNSDDLLVKIRDESVAPIVRSHLIDILASENSTPTPEVIGLIEDAAVAPEVRVQALVAYRYGRREAALLEKILKDSPDLVSFHALKSLTSADPDAASRVARDTLSSLKPQSDLRLSAAYKATIRTGAVRDGTVRAMLIDRLTAAVNDPESSMDLKDAAFFALSELNSADTLKILMKLRDMDASLVGGAIDQNAQMLLDVVKHEAEDEAALGFVVDAMEMHPVLEVGRALRQAAPGIRDDRLRERVKDVVDFIEREGVPRNKKWAER